jgi:hypothetical protein
MAANLNPIQVLSKDGEDSVWAFRNSQSGVKQLLAGSGITLSPASGLGAVTVTASGGGGGAVASVTGSGAGISVTPTTGAVVVSNTGVTSLAVAGGGITTSGSAGALTLTVPKGSNVYTLPDTDVATYPLPNYVKLGRWTTSRTGHRLHINVISANDYGGGSPYPQYTDLVLSTTTNGSFAPYYATGAASYDSTLGSQTNVPSSFVINVVSSTQYDIYGLFQYYTGSGAFYSIEIPNADTWLNSATLTGSSAPAGSNLVVTPVAKASVWSQFPATQTVTLNPGASTLDPYSTGSPATRNYLDINAPVAIGANKGALRLLGNGGTVALSIADTIDLTNIDTLNGHKLYVYGTFRSGAAASTSIASSPGVSWPFLTTTVVGVGCALNSSPPSGRYGAFNMTKTGVYNITAMIHINNTALTDTGTDVFLYNATTSTIVPDSTLTYYLKSGNYSVLTFIGTIPTYVVGHDYVIGFTAFSAGMVLDVPNGTPGTTVQIQLIG